MKCPKCQAENIQFQVVSENKGVGCMTVLLFPLIRANKTNTVTYAVCQKCGHRWQHTEPVDWGAVKKELSLTRSSQYEIRILQDKSMVRQHILSNFKVVKNKGDTITIKIIAFMNPVKFELTLNEYEQGTIVYAVAKCFNSALSPKYIQRAYEILLKKLNI